MSKVLRDIGKMELPLSNLDWAVLGVITVLSLGAALYLFFKTDREAKNFHSDGFNFTPIPARKKKSGLQCLFSREEVKVHLHRAWLKI